MKSTLLALALFTCSLSAFAGDSTPAISIEKALELAKQALADKGAGNVYVESIGLERTSILGGKQVWKVKWSSAVPGVHSGDREVGLQISMDGKVVHLVKDTTTPSVSVANQVR